MKLTIDIDFPEKTVEDILAELMRLVYEETTSINGHLDTAEWDADSWRFVFEDTHDEDKAYQVDKAKLLETFPLLFSDEWPASCAKPPTTITWEHWEHWFNLLDTDELEAFAQLACFGEVKYAD